MQSAQTSTTFNTVANGARVRYVVWVNTSVEDAPEQFRFADLTAAHNFRVGLNDPAYQIYPIG